MISKWLNTWYSGLINMPSDCWRTVWIKFGDHTSWSYIRSWCSFRFLVHRIRCSFGSTTCSMLSSCLSFLTDNIETLWYFLQIAWSMMIFAICILATFTLFLLISCDIRWSSIKSDRRIEGRQTTGQKRVSGHLKREWVPKTKYEFTANVWVQVQDSPLFHIAKAVHWGQNCAVDLNFG